MAEFDKACKAIVAILNKSGEGKIYYGVKDDVKISFFLFTKYLLFVKLNMQFAKSLKSIWCGRINFK
ncbi:MAG: hypothetical protein HUJ61_06760 [Bacilli bacterium]|nr:hypothetical protein [Bacilli bacterium]